MDLDISQNLMLGIATATDNFQNPQTSSLAFEMAGILMRNGALRPTSSSSPRRKLTADFEEKEEKPEVIDIQKEIHKEIRNQSAQPEEIKSEPTKIENPPDDWLEPKIYKGSTSF